MKATFRIPTKETYGFIEIEAEVECVEDAIIGYKESIKAYEGKIEGLPQKEWNDALDGYLEGNSMTSETYEAMSDTQRGVIQEIKKAKKRKNYNA